MAIVLAVWSTRWIVNESWYRPRSVMPSLPSSRCRGDPRETLLQIPDQIVDGLSADRQPHRPWPDAGRPQLVVAQLAVRRAGRVDDQALCVADVRQVGPERHAADEVLPAGPATGAVEREHRPGPARQVLLHERPVPARRQAGGGHIRRQLVRLEERRDPPRVLDVTFHA